jgi:hypothetical protein
VSDDSIRKLFDQWERVWHEGRYDLISVCVGNEYIRHDERGDRTVTRDAYTAEITALRQERPDIRVVVYDHSFEGDRAWFRFCIQVDRPSERRAAQSRGDAIVSDRGRQAR